MMKKTWSAPVVEELSISATLGGPNKGYFETQYINPPPVPDYGTIPNPAP